MHNILRAELKFDAGSGDDVKTMSFTGYGAVFGNVDSYGDVIQPGAFADTLSTAKKSGQWPAMLLQHGGFGLGAEDMTPIGVWTELSEDGHGLKVSGQLADTQRGRDAYALMKMSPRAAITGLSIGYIPKEFEQGTKPGEPRRKLKRVDLIEVSLVTFPANPKARVSSVKSAADIRILEQALRDAGLSRSEAKAVLAEGFKALEPLRDAEGEALAAITNALRKNAHLLRT